MKMTADTLLKAMSYADEALVEQTAPKHSGEMAGQKPRRFIIRRFTEIAAVCAAPTVACPPAIPIVLSGEVIDAASVAAIQAYGIREIAVVQ